MLLEIGEETGENCTLHREWRKNRLGLLIGEINKRDEAGSEHSAGLWPLSGGWARMWGRGVVAVTVGPGNAAITASELKNKGMRTPTLGKAC
jgi:hypothetical protein